LWNLIAASTNNIILARLRKAGWKIFAGNMDKIEIEYKRYKIADRSGVIEIFIQEIY